MSIDSGYLRAPGDVLPVLDQEEQRVYVSLYEQVEQFRKRRGPMALKDEEQAEIAHERWVAELVRRVPIEQTLKGYPPEQILKAYAPEQRMAGIPPEQRMADLTPEQRLLGLTDDTLAAFPDAYLRSLSPETQAAIRLRLGRPS